MAMLGLNLNHVSKGDGGRYGQSLLDIPTQGHHQYYRHVDGIRFWKGMIPLGTHLSWSAKSVIL